MTRHPQSPLLDHCPPTLPAHAYYDAEWFASEQKTIWSRNWNQVGRLSDFAFGTMRRFTIAGAGIIVCRDAEGSLSAFYNTCRHRGSELCSQDEKPFGKLITCPYHAWSYASDGRLVSTAFATPTPDFRKQDHGLIPVHLMQWNGFIFVCLCEQPPVLLPDPGFNALDNWQMESLVTGHTLVRDLACNWKVFWENYNECLHCPGIHPELSDLVPAYAKGIMSQREAPGWTPENAKPGGLRPGASSWTMSGEPCGPLFPGLTAQERANGYNFVTVYPTLFIVGHVDYVRSVSVVATGPQTTRLTAQWLFSPQTLAQPGFSAAQVAAFASMVLDQDAAATEMNQRGIRSPSYKHGTLMPQEFDILRFHHWVMDQMQTGSTK